MDDLLASVISDALAQADDVIDLGAVRAQVWASDLVALALEAGPDGAAAVVDALIQRQTPATSAALWAIDSVVGGLDTDVAAFGPAPSWAGTLPTSTCEAAWLISDWRGRSAAFRFVDGADERHVLLVDLTPGEPGADETVGEVTVGPVEVLDAMDDPDANLTAEPVPAPALAARVARAVRATAYPSASLVANGRFLIVRLATLGVSELVPPVWIEPAVPALPQRNREDDAWACGIVQRAFGDGTATDHAVSFGLAADTLRAAAASDAPVARWLAASSGPVDLDDPDPEVVVAALAATVAPASLEPLAPSMRDAVLELEIADWLGAVLGLCRAGVGTSTDPLRLVDHVNRCPEVTTEIPQADRDRVAWAFGVVTEPWRELGLVEAATLTAFGCAVLPEVLLTAWSTR